MDRIWTGAMNGKITTFLILIGYLFVDSLAQRTDVKCGLDILWVFDTSCSISESNRTLIRNFIKDVADNFNYGANPGQTLMSVLTFDKGAEHQFYFHQVKSITKFKRMASNIDLNAVQCKTLTWQALQRAPKYFETANGGREEAADVILLVSDGVTYPRKKAYKTIAAAQQFKLKYELFIFALPNEYGNDGLGELETMANDVSGRILRPGQFEQLPRYVKKLRKALCAVRKPDVTTTVSTDRTTRRRRGPPTPTMPPIEVTPDKKETTNPTRDPNFFTESTTRRRRGPPTPTMPPIIVTPGKKVTSNPTRDPDSFTDSTTRRMKGPPTPTIPPIVVAPDKKETSNPTRDPNSFTDRTTRRRRGLPTPTMPPIVVTPGKKVTSNPTRDPISFTDRTTRRRRGRRTTTMPPIKVTPGKKVTSNPTRDPNSFTDSTTRRRRGRRTSTMPPIIVTSGKKMTSKPTRDPKVLPDSTTTASRDGRTQGGEPLIPSTDATTPDDQTVKPASVLCPFGFHDETHKDSCQIFMSSCDLRNEKCCGCGFAFAHPDNGTLPQWPTSVLYKGKCYCELCLNTGCIPPHIKDTWAKEKRQWEKSRNGVK
ncbi:unnamed protein product [Owenia fusiformis]|uniref:Uncharacterized protein n=1 Tax=Owenia fusiformis TaxID=6347 RepID=A0A8J1TXY0_OWEFU|nr:unnamed protein product [Owenia fusiformis]